MPQGNYMPEGLLSGISFKTAAESAIKQAIDGGVTVESVVTRCDGQHNLYCEMGRFTGIIPRELAALEENSKGKEIAVISKVGKSVCFKITGEMRDGMYVLSRKAAQKEALDYFMENLMPGDVLKGKITHIEPFGVFVDIGCGNIGLIGIENISVSRISSPFDRFTAGQEILCVVKHIDREKRRVTLSHKELLGTWSQNACRFRAGETVRGIVRGIEEYGIFVELTPNLSGLSEYRDDVEIGSSVSVYIKSIIPEKMKIKLLIIDKLEMCCQKPISFEDYCIADGSIDSFRYTPPECRFKTIETIFK